MDAGPSTSRRGSHSLSPSSRHKHLRSTDVLSPESPPTYNSLDDHERSHGVTDTDRLLDAKGKRRSRDDDEGSEDELDALRLDLDGVGGEGGGGAGAGTAQSAEEEALRIASLDQRKALWWKNTLITGLFICSWYVDVDHVLLPQFPGHPIAPRSHAGSRYFFATLLSLYNKWMFSPQYYGFSFPLFVTFCHMIVQFCLAAILRIVWAERYRPVERPTRRDYV